jgi:hypothetical protein
MERVSSSTADSATAYPTGQGAFDSRLLDLVRRENDYALCQGASPLLTPAGHEVAHPDLRLLQHMIRELSFADPARGALAMSSVLFAIQKDLIEVGHDPMPGVLSRDEFPSTDRFSLHFWNLVKSWLGQDTTACIRAAFEPVAGKTVFVVHCQRSPKPVFLNAKGGEEEFYIRVGPSSERLGIRDALRYIANRFPGSAAGSPPTP